MGMTIEAMRAEGCDWTLLYSSEMGKSLYPLLGYAHMSASYRRGLVASRDISAPSE